MNFRLEPIITGWRCWRRGYHRWQNGLRLRRVGRRSTTLTTPHRLKTTGFLWFSISGALGRILQLFPLSGLHKSLQLGCQRIANCWTIGSCRLRNRGRTWRGTRTVWIPCRWNVTRRWTLKIWYGRVCGRNGRHCPLHLDEFLYDVSIDTPISLMDVARTGIVCIKSSERLVKVEERLHTSQNGHDRRNQHTYLIVGHKLTRRAQ